MTGLTYLLHCLEQVATSICPGLQARRVQPSAILQLVLRVEAEKVGRTLRVVGSRHFLRLIDDVGKGEAVLRGKRLHVVKGVLTVCRRIVRHDRNRADADIAQDLASATIRSMLAFTYGQ
jgi:hypothetical protein